ncbi:MAG: TRAP transporter small permease [Pseudomonadota bacterium]
MDRMIRASHTLSRWLVWLGGVLLIGSALLVTAEVFLRKFANISIGGADEISGYAFAVATALAFSYALFERAHIRVELVHAWMPPRVQAGMDVVADLAALLFFGLLLWQAVLEAQYSIRIDEKTVGLIRMPLWPARIVLAVGTGLLILRLLVDLAIDLCRVRTGAPPPTASSAEST